MRAFFVRLITLFVPKKTWRGYIRSKLLQNSMDVKVNNIMERMLYEIEKTRQLNYNHMFVKQIHTKTFEQYKNIFAGQEVALVGTGPSLSNFKHINNVTYVGVNGAFQYDKIKFDYLFAQDYSGMNYIEELGKYSAVKFYGILPSDWTAANGKKMLIPESIAIRHNAKRYMVASVIDPKYSKYSKNNIECFNIAYDLTIEPIADYNSIVFSAMQFILWGNPRRVYLVGCDCSLSGYYNGGVNVLNIKRLLFGWNKLKEFCEAYYPETEIVSINPMGLKGLFIDEEQL